MHDFKECPLPPYYLANGSENMCNMLKPSILAGGHSSETFNTFRRILLKLSSVF
jgi:hypothetical protein